MRIPPPTDWAEFELITQSSLKIKWGSPNLQRNGRQGQPQAGVDVYGEDNLGRPVGVQCRNVTEKLTLAAIQEEIQKAECFDPPLQAYYIATTLPNDSRLQKELRLISLDRISSVKFPVGIFFWEDLIHELVKNLSEFSKHYPNIKVADFEKEIKGLQLLAILDITYFGLQLQSYVNLIFSKFGRLADENPLNVRAIGLIVQNCASLIMPSEECTILNRKVQRMVNVSLSPCSSEKENENRWREVDKYITEITQDITTLEYRMKGLSLGTFHMGRILGEWNHRLSMNDIKISSDVATQILNYFKVIGASANDIKIIRAEIDEYNKIDSVSNIHIPGRVYNFARRTILNREIAVKPL